MSGTLQIQYQDKPEELISYYTLQQLDDITKTLTKIKKGVNYYFDEGLWYWCS